MQEIWKPVSVDSGIYSDRYEVSNLGNVRANPNARVPGMKPGRVLFQSTGTKNYGQVQLYLNRKPKTFKVARLVMTAFVGERQDGFSIDHIDGNKANNALSNLEYVSYKDNIRRSYNNGIRDEHMSRLRNGDWNWAKKLTFDKAEEIRRRVLEGEKRAHLAKEFGVHVMTVGEIVRGDIWAK